MITFVTFWRLLRTGGCAVVVFTMIIVTGQMSTTLVYDLESQTYNQTANWKPSPNTRGTYSIVSSCVLTLGLCMWSAIHLDIPSTSRATWQWTERCEWLFWAMILPDVIVYQALCESVAAGEVSHSLGRIL